MQLSMGPELVIPIEVRSFAWAVSFACCACYAWYGRCAFVEVVPEKKRCSYPNLPTGPTNNCWDCETRTHIFPLISDAFPGSSFCAGFFPPQESWQFGHSQRHVFFLMFWFFWFKMGLPSLLQVGIRPLGAQQIMSIQHHLHSQL